MVNIPQPPTADPRHIDAAAEALDRWVEPAELGDFRRAMAVLSILTNWYPDAVQIAVTIARHDEADY